MKHLLKLSLAAALVVALSACKKEEPKADEHGTETAADAAPADAPAPAPTTEESATVSHDHTADASDEEVSSSDGKDTAA